jgi:hypothetical protein
VSAQEDQNDPWLRFENRLDRKPEQAKLSDWGEMQRLVDLGSASNPSDADAANRGGGTPRLSWRARSGRS